MTIKELNVISLLDFFRFLNPEHQQQVRDFAVKLLDQEQSDLTFTDAFLHLDLKTKLRVIDYEIREIRENDEHLSFLANLILNMLPDDNGTEDGWSTRENLVNYVVDMFRRQQENAERQKKRRA